MEEKRFGNVLYAWEANEYEQSARPRHWYLLVGGVTLLIAGLLIWWGNYILAAVVLVAGIVIYLMSRSHPKRLRHMLTDRGVVVGNKFYEYTRFKSFWVTRASDSTTINFSPTGKINMILTVRLEDSNPEDLKTLLTTYLTEEPDRGEDVLDRIGKWFGF